MLMIKIMIFKNVLYYQQGVTQILSANAFKILLYPLASIFNLSIMANTATNVEDLWCFINGLNAKEKILIDLFVPINILSIICFVYLLSKYVFRKPLIFKNKKVNFSKTMIASYLLMIGKILNVLFQLLNCQKVGEETVHFYFGYEKCYGITWISSFISLIF